MLACWGSVKWRCQHWTQRSNHKAESKSPLTHCLDYNFQHIYIYDWVLLSSTKHHYQIVRRAITRELHIHFNEFWKDIRGIIIVFAGVHIINLLRLPPFRRLLDNIPLSKPQQTMNDELSVILRPAGFTDINAIISLVLTSFRHFPLFDYLYEPLRSNINYAHDTVFFWNRRLRIGLCDPNTTIMIAEVPSDQLGQTIEDAGSARSKRVQRNDEETEEAKKMLTWVEEKTGLSQTYTSPSDGRQMTIVGFSIWIWHGVSPPPQELSVREYLASILTQAYSRLNPDSAFWDDSNYIGSLLILHVLCDRELPSPWKLVLQEDLCTQGPGSCALCCVLGSRRRSCRQVSRATIASVFHTYILCRVILSSSQVL